VTNQDKNLAELIQAYAEQNHAYKVSETCDSALAGDQDALDECKRIMREACSYRHQLKCAAMIEWLKMNDADKESLTRRPEWWLKKFAKRYPKLSPRAVYDAVIDEVKRRI
jgi:hypothetical protein